MAKQVVVGARTFWIISEPAARGWTAKVMEVVEGADPKLLTGIEGTGETRSAADDAAHGSLQRWLKGEDAPRE